MKFFAVYFPALMALIWTTSCSSHSPMPGNHNHGGQNVEHNQQAGRTNNSGQHLHSENDPHMRMTKLRVGSAEDKKRAEEIADSARWAIEKYKDHRAALADRFEILLPEVPQNMYHFNKLENYMEAESRFNPERPTSLLYEKISDTDYKLIGVMYTAPAGMTEDELNERVPLSLTQWHQHIDICLPKGTDTFKGLIGQGEKFGLNGSITTREECEKEGGQFLPRLLGWMVHLYPYEKTTEQMWSVERQMQK